MQRHCLTALCLTVFCLTVLCLTVLCLIVLCLIVDGGCNLVVAAYRAVCVP